MRWMLRALIALQVFLPAGAVAADEKVLVELNSIESADNRCRVNFVVENKSDTAIDSLKLDLVAFGTDGGILRRLIMETASETEGVGPLEETLRWGQASYLTTASGSGSMIRMSSTPVKQK